MTTLTLLLRLTLILALAASPIVTSAMADGGETWSQTCGDPSRGVPQMAEEDEPAGHSGLAEAPTEEDAVSANPDGAARLGADDVHPEESTWATASPLIGDPTPPPQHD